MGQGRDRPPTEVTVRFIEDHRQVLGVEPVFRAMQIAPSTIFEYKALHADPETAREKRDEELKAEIKRYGMTTSTPMAPTRYDYS